MSFDFGNSLRKLRISRELTQEEVAELLQVTKQTVSRWENNTTCPDIFFLPKIAAFYGVTVDSLFGVSSNKEEVYMNKCFDDRQTAHHRGDIAEAYKISQELYNRFPNNLRVINCFMSDSYLMGLHNVNNEKKKYLQQSITVSERFIKMSEDIEENCRAIRNIATCFKLLGNQDLAISWLNKLPSSWSSIETVSLSVYEGKALEEAMKYNLDPAIHLIYRIIYAVGERYTKSPKIRSSILEKIPALFEVLFENNDFGFYNCFLSRVYFELATMAEDSEKIGDYISKAVFCAKQYDEAAKSEHSSILFNGKEILPEEWTTANCNTKMDFLKCLCIQNGLEKYFAECC